MQGRGVWKEFTSIPAIIVRVSTKLGQDYEQDSRLLWEQKYICICFLLNDYRYLLTGILLHCWVSTSSKSLLVASPSSSSVLLLRFGQHVENYGRIGP